jgi:di/tripeptidase
MSQTLKYFKEITAYPRPSKQEEKIRNFLINFFSEK